MSAVLCFEQTPCYVARSCSRAHRGDPQGCTGAEKSSVSGCKHTVLLLFFWMRIPHDDMQSNLIRIKDYCHLSRACYATGSSQITFLEVFLLLSDKEAKLNCESEEGQVAFNGGT